SERYAGPQLHSAARRQAPGRLANVDVLPLLPLPDASPGATALRRAHRRAQADLLQQARPVGALRPEEGPAGDAQRLRRSRVCGGAAEAEGGIAALEEGTEGRRPVRGQAAEG